MNEDTGVHYVTPWEIGKEIGGFIGVGQVIKSSDPAFSPGDIVEAQAAWPWVALFKRKQEEQNPLRKVITGRERERVMILFLSHQLPVINKYYLSFFDCLATISGRYFFAGRKTDTTPHSSWLDWTHIVLRYQRKGWH